MVAFRQTIESLYVFGNKNTRKIEDVYYIFKNTWSPTLAYKSIAGTGGRAGRQIAIDIK
jgi:hypothetical protein